MQGSIKQLSLNSQGIAVESEPRNDRELEGNLLHWVKISRQVQRPQDHIYTKSSNVRRRTQMGAVSQQRIALVAVVTQVIYEQFELIYHIQ